MNKEKIHILMTCTGGDLAPEYILAMKNSERYDVKLFAVDGNADALGRYFADGFSVVPMGHAEDYIEKVLNIVEREKIDLVIAGSDGEALSLSLNKEAFSKKGCIIACPSADILATLSNKAETYQVLKHAGIPCADFEKVENISKFSEAIISFLQKHKEIVIKPAVSRGGRNVFVIRADIEKEEHYHGGREIHCSRDIFETKYQKDISKLLPLIVMERLFEPTYDIDILSWEGEAINIVPRKRHNPAGIPFDGNTIVMDSALIDLARKACQAFHLSWLLDIDVMCDAKGNPVILEINPRMSGSCPASIHAGVPLFDNIIALARGDTPVRVEPKNGTVIMGYKALKKVLIS